MAITQYGQKVNFGTKELSGFIVQNGSLKEAWDVKTWVGANGIESAGVKYKHRFEVSLSVIGGETKPSDTIITTYFSVEGTVVVTDITETHTPEDAVQYDITATIYPDMAAA